MRPSKNDPPSLDQSTWLQRFVENYKRDHQHPVNHVLHVFVGWPLVAFSILCLPFELLWSIGFFLSGYALMFFGHFAFEGNAPTILSKPATPFVIAWAVIGDLARGFRKLLTKTFGQG